MSTTPEFDPFLLPAQQEIVEKWVSLLCNPVFRGYDSETRKRIPESTCVLAKERAKAAPAPTHEQLAVFRQTLKDILVKGERKSCVSGVSLEKLEVDPSLEAAIMASGIDWRRVPFQASVQYWKNKKAIEVRVGSTYDPTFYRLA